ncbi:MAG: hypothetical protein AAGE52_38735 [Myxococcota bacterium]
MSFAMFGFAPFRRPALLLLALLAGACHSSKSPDDEPDAFTLDAGTDGGRMGREAGPGDGGFDFDVFVDPGCDAGPPSDAGVRMFDCDPLVEDSCGPDQACYASAVPPDGPCGEETFVAFCAAPGPGAQGDSCLGHTECQVGHLCVVTGAGTQCVEACDPGGGEPGCPRGFLCRSTDVPGYGACF